MILVIDLEATCCDQGTIPPEKMEIIELGAVWSTLQGEIIDTLQRFVRPSEHPQLTPFCRLLTHIEQTELEAKEECERYFSHENVLELERRAQELLEEAHQLRKQLGL